MNRQWHFERIYLELQFLKDWEQLRQLFFLISVTANAMYMLKKLGQPGIQTCSDPKKGKIKVNVLSARRLPEVGLVSQCINPYTVTVLKTRPWCSWLRQMDYCHRLMFIFSKIVFCYLKVFVLDSHILFLTPILQWQIFLDQDSEFTLSVTMYNI